MRGLKEKVAIGSGEGIVREGVNACNEPDFRRYQ